MPGTPVTLHSGDDQEALAVAGLFVYRDWLRRLTETGLDLLFPPRCAGCGRVDFDWCWRCDEALSQTPLEATLKPLAGITVLCTGTHEGKLQTAIHALKYDNLRRLAPTLGQRMVDCLHHQDWRFDMIVPVPLHAERMKERGYNQAELLGDAISQSMDIPCVPSALTRRYDTRSQVGLNHDQRLLNVAEAFAADGAQVAGATLLLVDDVCTTGATLVTCAQTALAAGARAVYGVALTTPRPLL